MAIFNVHTVLFLLFGVSLVTLWMDLATAQVADIVTEDFFNSVNQNFSGCESQGFYTRRAFLNAASFTEFGSTGTGDDRRREIAAFFAHIKYATESFCYVEARNKSKRNCDPVSPCAEGKSYYARGPIQLAWNYNYEDAGRALGFDGINAPEMLARDPMMAFKTAVWFWMSNSDSHKAIVSGQGFGATIRAVNSDECNGGNDLGVSTLGTNYVEFCRQLGVAPGDNLSC